MSFVLVVSDTFCDLGVPRVLNGKPGLRPGIIEATSKTFTGNVLWEIHHFSSKTSGKPVSVESTDSVKCFAFFSQYKNYNMSVDSEDDMPPTD